MTLKSARLARAEHLSPEQQQKIGQTKGLVIIETRNTNLRQEFVPVSGGIREYLLKLGKFKDAELRED